MAQTADYGLVRYILIILQYSEKLYLYFLTELYGALTAVVLLFMFGLLCGKTFGTMTNYDNGDEDGDNNGKEDGNNDNNATSGLGSDGPIFDPITTPQSRRG